MSLFESLAEEAIKAMAPDVESVFKSLISGSLKAAPVSGADVATAKNLEKALPAATASDFTTVKTIAGNAVAKYQETNAGADLQTDASFSSITSLTLSGITSEGLDAAMIKPNTVRQIVSSAIEMSLAGLGVKPTTVGADASTAS